MKRALLDALLAVRRAGGTAALVTDLATGDQALVTADRGEGDLALTGETLAAVHAAMAADRSHLLENAGRRLFVHVFAPPPRLIVIGAVHVAEPLARIAALAGFAVTIVDPRRAYRERAVFAGVVRLADWPDAALASLAPDARTAIVTLSHDPKLDDLALIAALRSDAFYVGALGSRRTQAARRDRLRAAGFDESEIARLHGPVGLAIGALTPAEIAVAITAEIIAVRRGRHTTANRAGLG
jgi:xanthine dehydrogenase accessory factor